MLLAVTRTKNDLDVKIAALINAYRNTPFKFGELDCCIWGALSIDTICNTTLVNEIIGQYNDVRGAIKFLKDHYGANNVLDVFGDRLPSQHVSSARYGDLVYQKSNYMGFNAVIGICYGLHSFFINEDEQGLIHFPTLQCDGSFKVG